MKKVLSSVCSIFVFLLFDQPIYIYICSGHHRCGKMIMCPASSSLRCPATIHRPMAVPPASPASADSGHFLSFSDDPAGHNVGLVHRFCVLQTKPRVITRCAFFTSNFRLGVSSLYQAKFKSRLNSSSSATIFSYRYYKK